MLSEDINNLPQISTALSGATNGSWTGPGGLSTSISPSTWTTGTFTPPTKEWAKIKCHGCGKELGFVKDSHDWKVDSYYCEDCRLLEKLKE